eukprot:TRINITY_DN4315_c0_g1_i1.p1 TRINITY_DN4315_c0_g1~~TRINITY_DN4315_c0_g1_i1.p1  ORF type:complete len:225 (+),score=71.08 TRINITY_DN4315_c0_g1_i1:62-676(+)
MRRAMAALLLMCSVSAGSAGWLEERVASAEALVRASFGDNFTSVEADAVRLSGGRAQPMTDVDSASELRLVSVRVNATVPGIEAHCALRKSSAQVACNFTKHDDPLLEDRVWPPLPEGGLTAEGALALVRAKAECTGFTAVNYRFPLFPCASEYLYIFTCVNATATTQYFVGTDTRNVCTTMATRQVVHAPPMCTSDPNRPRCL